MQSFYKQFDLTDIDSYIFNIKEDQDDATNNFIRKYHGIVDPASILIKKDPAIALHMLIEAEQLLNEFNPETDKLKYLKHINFAFLYITKVDCYKPILKKLEKQSFTLQELKVFLEFTNALLRQQEIFLTNLATFKSAEVPPYYKDIYDNAEFYRAIAYQTTIYAHDKFLQFHNGKYKEFFNELKLTGKERNELSAKALGSRMEFLCRVEKTHPDYQCNLEGYMHEWLASSVVELNRYNHGLTDRIDFVNFKGSLEKLIVLYNTHSQPINISQEIYLLKRALNKINAPELESNVEVIKALLKKFNIHRKKIWNSPVIFQAGYLCENIISQSNLIEKHRANGRPELVIDDLNNIILLLQVAPVTPMVLCELVAYYFSLGKMYYSIHLQEKALEHLQYAVYLYEYNKLQGMENHHNAAVAYFSLASISSEFETKWDETRRYLTLGIQASQLENAYLEFRNYSEFKTEISECFLKSVKHLLKLGNIEEALNKAFEAEKFYKLCNINQNHPLDFVATHLKNNVKLLSEDEKNNSDNEATPEEETPFKKLEKLFDKTNELANKINQCKKINLPKKEDLKFLRKAKDDIKKEIQALPVNAEYTQSISAKMNDLIKRLEAKKTSIENKLYPHAKPQEIKPETQPRLSKNAKHKIEREAKQQKELEIEAERKVKRETKLAAAYEKDLDDVAESMVKLTFNTKVRSVGFADKNVSALFKLFPDKPNFPEGINGQNEELFSLFQNNVFK